MKSNLVAALIVLVSGSAYAGVVQKWQGSGSLYQLDGTKVSDYTVSVVNTETTPSLIKSETTVTYADHSTMLISQTIQMTDKGWKILSSLGEGDGTCYGVDLCENYIQDHKGLAYATTIVNDGPSSKRDMTVVLENGKATKILRDQISLVQ